MSGLPQRGDMGNYINRTGKRSVGCGGVKSHGIPRLVSPAQTECPWCGGKTVFEIEIIVYDEKHERLPTDQGLGRYITCAACPWVGDVHIWPEGQGPKPLPENWDPFAGMQTDRIE